jgi:hypothetical protein
MGQNTRVSGRATSITYHPDGTLKAVTYHRTEVVYRYQSGEVILNSGGWRTVTTKLRMNQAARQFGLPYGVFQKKGEWYVGRHDKNGGYTKGEDEKFRDGMVIDNRGNVTAISMVKIVKELN